MRLWGKVVGDSLDYHIGELWWWKFPKARKGCKSYPLVTPYAERAPSFGTAGVLACIPLTPGALM